MARTGQQLADTLSDAAQAVRHYYGVDERGYRHDSDAMAGRPAPAARDAYAEVDRALFAGHTPAAIAAAAGVRQLLVARLIGDEKVRARALITARHDAQRYLDQVRQALQEDCRSVVAAGMSEVAAAELYGVTRMTVRAWLGKR